MSTRKKAFKSAGLLAGGRVASQVLAFGRNVFVARILTPEDYGLAATFWITTGLLATITEFGFQQRLIQAKDGDDKQVGAVAQSLFVLRGLLIGGVLLLIAEAVARLFGAPEAIWAFRLLALLPVIGGFRHCDLDRLTRHLNFKPSVAANLVSEGVITLAAVPIALATRDYSAFLYLALIKTALLVGMSHWLAERPFRLAWNRQIVARFISFGWPLLINSFLMYGMMQGDRIILAGAYSKAELGVYSVAIGLVTAVIGMATAIINPLVLPLVARVQDDRVAFERYYRLHMTIMAAIAAIAGLGFILLGPVAILLVYGPKYALAAGVVGWIGVAQSLRLLRMPVMNAAMARGDTKTSMYANIFRQVGIVLALIAAWRGMSLDWIAISSVGGELLAVTAAGILLMRWHEVSSRVLWRTMAFVCTILALSVGIGHWVSSNQSHWIPAFVFTVMTLVMIPIYLTLFPMVRHEIRIVFDVVRRRMCSVISPPEQTV